MIGLKIAMEGHKATSDRVKRIAKTMKRNIDKSTAQEAHLLRRMIVMGIRRQAPGGKKFLPLQPETIKAKGSSKALIDKGDLIRSINVQPFAGGAAYFVGVHKMAGSKNGVPLANIAEVHEFGTRDGRIPERPYLRPAFAMWKKGIQSRMMTRLVDFMGLGKPALFALKVKDKILSDSTGKAKKFAHQVSAVYNKGGRLSWKIS
jgi:hypothetical protein